MGPVEALDAALAQHLGAIQRAAFGSPPGGGPEWDAMLRHYGVPPLDPQERTMIVSCMRLSRGAVPAEVRVVFAGLQAWAQRELDQLRSSGAATGSPALAGVQQRVATLVDFEVSAYERALGIPSFCTYGRACGAIGARRAEPGFYFCQRAVDFERSAVGEHEA